MCSGSVGLQPSTSPCFSDSHRPTPAGGGIEPREGLFNFRVTEIEPSPNLAVGGDANQAKLNGDYSRAAAVRRVGRTAPWDFELVAWSGSATEQHIISTCC